MGAVVPVPAVPVAPLVPEVPAPAVAAPCRLPLPVEGAGDASSPGGPDVLAGWSLPRPSARRAMAKSRAVA